MIIPTLARMIVREHLYKPIQGRLLTLGRQTIAMNYYQVQELFKQEGYSPHQDVINKLEVALDQSTRLGRGKGYISDQFFFELLGIKELYVLDVSKYEGCNIVHNLNKPVPDSFYGQFDFIIDGGTFDHLFDIKTCFENVVRMLKPNGRIFQWNAASNFSGAAYISFGPDLFYDFFVLNQFADCKVYIAEVDSFAQKENWDLYEFQGLYEYDHFLSSRIQMVVVLAEKSPQSTCYRFPVQAQYRDDFLWEPYKGGKARIDLSTRKSLSSSKSYKPVSKKLRGFKYIGCI